MPHADFLDQAEETAQAFTDESVAKVRKALEPETHPDFDGESCVDCWEAIAKGRLTLGKVRCIYCQEILEKKSKLFPGLATHSHLGVGHPLHKKSDKTNEDEPTFIALPEDSKTAEVVLRKNRGNKGKTISSPEALKPPSKSLLAENLKGSVLADLINSAPPSKADTSLVKSNQFIPPIQALTDAVTPLKIKPKRIRIRVRSKPKNNLSSVLPLKEIEKSKVENSVILKTQEKIKNTSTIKNAVSEVKPKEVQSAEKAPLYRDDYRRLIERVGSVSLSNSETKRLITLVSLNSWRCTLTHRETEKSTVYYYVDRGSARLARISHLVGAQGRIA